MPSKKIPIEGGKELAKKLKELPYKTSETFVASAMMTEAKPIMDAMKKNAPEDTGRLKMFIVRSSRKGKGKVKINVGVMRMNNKKFEKSGLTSSPYYAGFTEFGTKHQKAQHWMLRSIEETSEEFVDRYMNKLREKIMKEASSDVKKRYRS